MSSQVFEALLHERPLRSEQSDALGSRLSPIVSSGL